MGKNTREYGTEGERLAAKALKKQGYTILAKNYSRKCGEIDIIARKKSVIYFVEVKSRHNTDYLTPSANVNAAKRRHIAQTAAIWFAEHGEAESSFLVAEVDLQTNSVNLIEDFLQ